MAFYQKYRPKFFVDLIGEDHIRETLLEASKSDKMSHAFLLCGPRGTGKTTTARLLAKALNCQQIIQDRLEKKEITGEPCNKCEACLEIDEGRAIDVVEIDAASHTKVDEIREVIDKARFMPAKLTKKVYIIDEVHMLSTSSFNALLKTLEEPPAHVVFILATTEVHKLPATIVSRVQRYDFRRIKKDDIIQNLKKIAKAEKIEIDDKVLDLIAVKAEGGHRDAVSLLEQISATGDTSYGNASKVLGHSDSGEILAFVEAIFSNHPEEGLKIAQDAYGNGASMIQFNKEVIVYLRLILLSTVSQRFKFDDTKENIASIQKLSSMKTSTEIAKMLDVFIKAGQMLKDIAFPLMPIEMAVIEATHQVKNENIKNKNDSSKSKISKQEQELKIEYSKLERASVKPEEADLPADKTEELTSPVAVFEMTKDLWQKVIDEVKKENATLAALLRDAKPLELTEKKMNLGVKFAFHKDKISEAKNCAILERVIENILGQKLAVVCKISNGGEKKASEALPDDELQKAAEEIFLS